jgi:uncharacterized protein (DUF433 family)
MEPDWSRFEDAERISGKVSGAWLLKGTRIRIEDVLLNSIDQTPEDIVTQVYPSLTVELVQRVIDFAQSHAPRFMQTLSDIDPCAMA